MESTALRPTDRLFFAVFPDAAAASAVERLAHRLRAAHGLQGRPLPIERFHVTLHFLGDHAGLPADIVAAATQAAASLVARPFEVVFDRAASFSRRQHRKPFVLLGREGVAALSAFQRTLGEALVRVGLARRIEPRFTPHLTLLYDDQAVPEQPVEPVRWTVSEFVLVHSLLGRTRHLPLGRWPLRG
jgi:2'-5' RNA ligase